MRHLTLMWALLVLTLTGCNSDQTAATKAKADADAARAAQAEAEGTLAKAEAELAKVKSDLKWARSVAEDFLGAVKADDAKAAYGLLSPDYRDRLTEKERKEGTFAFSPFLRDDARNAAAWSITGEALAPNGIEARFTGGLTFKSTRLIRAPNGGEISHTETKVYPFTLLITRAKDSDLWRSDLFTVAKEARKE